MTPLSPGKFRGLTRMADSTGRFTMLAVDQRPPIKAVVAERRREVEPRAEDVRAVKRLLMEVLAPHATAVLADPTHALMDALTILLPEHGLVVTMEDSQFRETLTGRWSNEIEDWSVSKIRRVGGDAVKVLTWYRPDQDAASLANQHDFSKRIGDACAKYDIPYLLEMLVYPLPSETGHTVDYVEQPGKRADHVLETVAEFAKPDYGVDVFKLESPIPANEVPAPGDAETAKLFAEMGRLAGRPWVMLSAGASRDAFRNVLAYAYDAGASGFLAGRAIWWADFHEHFPDMDKVRAGLAANGVPYMQDLTAMTAARARPWTDWYDGAARPVGFDATWFQGGYADLEGNL